MRSMKTSRDFTAVKIFNMLQKVDDSDVDLLVPKRKRKKTGQIQKEHKKDRFFNIFPSPK